MITIIVAADQNNLIGKKGTDNGMPWHNSEDFKPFRSTTLNHTLLMGKTTYQAIGKPLPKRHTIVLSHNFEDDRVEMFVFSISLAETLKDVEKLNIKALLKINKDIFLFIKIPLLLNIYLNIS